MIGWQQVVAKRPKTASFQVQNNFITKTRTHSSVQLSNQPTTTIFTKKRSRFTPCLGTSAEESLSSRVPSIHSVTITRRLLSSSTTYSQANRKRARVEKNSLVVMCRYDQTCNQDGKFAENTSFFLNCITGY